MKIQQCLLAGVLAATAVAAGAADTTRQERMDEAYANWQAQNGRSSDRSTMRSPRADRDMDRSDRNGRSRMERAGDSVKSGAVRTRNALERAQDKTANALSRGSRKTGEAFGKAGDKIEEKTGQK